MPGQVILWGGTGQAKVNRPIITSRGGRVVAVFDDTPGLVPPFNDVPLYRGRREFERWLQGQAAPPVDLGYCVAIGNPHGASRIEISVWLAGFGLKPVDVIHASSVIEAGAELGEGVQLMALAAVCAEARVGAQCIINTKASVDHECVLGDGVELGPGATVCGSVRIGRCAWICAGATVLPRVTIGEGAIVGAGAVVTRDVAPNVTVVGIPCRALPGRR